MSGQDASVTAPPADLEAQVARLEALRSHREAEVRRQLAMHRPIPAPAPVAHTAALIQSQHVLIDAYNAHARTHGGTPMPKLSAIANDKTKLTVPLGQDEELKVTYRPSRMTPRLMEQVQQAEKDGSISGALLAPLAELLVSWDLTDDEEEPIPTTVEALSGVPFVILRHVLEAVAAAMADAARNGTGR